MNRALFVDRDGILNELVAWGGNLAAPRHWAEVKFCPEIIGLPQAKSLGFRLVLITNQPDVERGITPQAFVDELNEKYRREFSFDGVYCCTASSNSDPMKKPNPGMLLKAAQDLNLDLSRSFFLGDTDRDVVAAQRAGCRSILWDRPYNRSLPSDFRVDSLSRLLELLQLNDNINY
jgi:D-glycero-D-manno-heptose 1,7-bisphosphate phosphatase